MLRPRVGISDCLLGSPVRYDGGHKRDAVVLEHFEARFELVAFCPEVAIGLGVPRPSIHLVAGGDEIRAVRLDAPDIDVTQRLIAYAGRLAPEVAGLSGFIFKARSPSCGVASTPLGDGATAGIFAGAIMRLDAALPVVEETALGDSARRRRFIEAVEARWRRLSAG